MVKFMNLKTRTFFNKRGSYILEAAIILPMVIICICALISVIRIVGICENITFVTSKHLLDAAITYYNEFNEISLCSEVTEDIEDVKDFKIVQFKYLFRDGDDNNLISLRTKSNFIVYNPIGINTNITFDSQVLCRGFAGNHRQSTPLALEEFNENKDAHIVVVFPRYGKRYHDEGCGYVKRNDVERAYITYMDREDAYRKGFTPCIVCKGAAYE